MNTDEKLNYMIGCLQVAKDEFGHMVEHDVMIMAWENGEIEKYRSYINRYGVPNKSIITDNLRNVARMAFKLAREIEHG